MEDQEKLLKVFEKDCIVAMTEGGKKYQLEYRLIMNGEAHHVRLIAVRTDNGENLIIALENIDEEVKRAKELEAISEKNVVFSHIAESLANQYGMIYYIDTETDEYIEFTSSKEYKSFQISPNGNDFFGTSQRNVSMIIHPADRERVFEALNKKTMLKRLEENDSFTLTYQLLLANGSSYTRMSVFWATDNKHLIIGVMNIDKEVRRELEVQEKLHVANEKAYRDELTGVKNKSAYKEMEANLQAMISTGTQKEFAVVVCDVNGLKIINDQYGHIEGDAYIKSACEIICRNWAHSPVFRVGGDEFAVILQGEDYKNRHALEKHIKDLVLDNKRNGKVIIAIGMADYAPGASVSDVFNQADNLMYENKSALKADSL